MDKLKICKIVDEEQCNCSICMDDLSVGDEYFDIECKHKFHKKCMIKWLEEYNYICPVCRGEIGKSKAHIE